MAEPEPDLESTKFTLDLQLSLLALSQIFLNFLCFVLFCFFLFFLLWRGSVGAVCEVEEVHGLESVILNYSFPPKGRKFGTVN